MSAIGASDLAAETPRASDVYVRRKMDLRQTTRWLAEEARRIDAAQVLFVFDLVTFAPPPGETEFTSDYAFFEDLDPWLDTLEAWEAERDVSFRVTTSLAPKSIAVGSPSWKDRVRSIAARDWWRSESTFAFEPADRWMQRLLVRLEDAPRASTAKGPRMLVLVAGHLAPERWVPMGTTQGFESEWRTRLLPPGEYWKSGEVAATLERQGTTLYAVAPEVRFGEMTPLAELPDAPWAARPELPSSSVRAPTNSVNPLSGLGSLPPEVRRLLEEELRRLGRTGPGGLGGALPPSGPRPPTTPGPAPTPPTIEAPPSWGLRFHATTPAFFDATGSVYLTTNHAPSGYGAWELARTVARTGGRYVFYPFPEMRFLDVCPADYGLLDRLAPELVSRAEYVSLRSGDSALDAICRAASKVVRDTPWSDDLLGGRAATGWSAFARASPVRLHPDWFPRRHPFDDARWGTEESIADLGERLGKVTLPQYDEALALLDRAIAEHEAGRDTGSHPRSVANLYLSRFWFSMSAFHLEAYGIYARELERFIPESMKGQVDHVYVTYVPTIRMSDCLPAYDGRELPPDAEADYRRWVPADAPGYQGNLLEIPDEDPNFRARRALDRVLLHLDPRLRRRALDMIQSGKHVMERYARSGWGWTTYYSDAFTFIFKPVPTQKGHHPTPGGSEPPPPKPTTPRGPSGGGTTPGGSSPGGPTTR